MKFTGHERDLANPAGTADDLDYMHARFANPQLGRLLSVDPGMPIGRIVKRPQMWNRYAYAMGNPLKYIDPTGALPFEWWRKAKAAVSKMFGIKAKDLTKPGPYAVESVPGTASRNIPPASRQELRALGEKHGCHTCGSKDFGTKSGNPTADHQPPIKLNAEGKPHELYPQCPTYSAKQGGQVSAALRTIVEFVPRLGGLMTALGLLEAGQEAVRVTGDAIEGAVVNSAAAEHMRQQQELIQEIEELE